MTLQLNFSSDYSINFCNIKQQRFIILKYKTLTSYFYLDPKVTFFKTSSNITFSNCSPKFSLAINDWFKRFERPITKKLVLVGLGLKASVDDTSRMLHLKLEYSHHNFIPIPLNIYVFIKKNNIILKSFDSISLGNFVYKIRRLRLPNIYKGKGICFKRSKQILKQIKKNK